MKNIILLMLISLSILNACQKKSTITNVPLDPAFKAAFNFLPGSYWIYKDSITGRIDSFFITRNEDNYVHTTVQGYYGPTNAPEIINMYMTERNVSLTIANPDTLSWELELEGTTFNAYCSDTNMYIGEIDYFPLINYPFQYQLIPTVMAPYSSEDSGTVTAISSSIEINGKTFTHVAIVNRRASLVSLNSYKYYPQYSYNDIFHICPDVGFVKIRLNHYSDDTLHRVWELQRWHIEK